MRLNTLIVFVLMMSLASNAGAMSSASYSISASGVAATSGSGSSSSYSSSASAGGGAVGTSSSLSYSGLSGSGGSISLSTDTTPPVIADLKIDSSSVINGDQIKNNGTLTATVTDNIGIDTAKSSVEVDGAFTTFASLASPSGYNVTTGALTFILNIASNGDHTVAVHAVDTNNNVTIVSRSTKVNTGDLGATLVRFYPNPFNPNSAAGVIAYQLNKDADVSVYIFDAVGQVIYKNNYLSGAMGGATGYNEVAWNGKDASGSIVGNDIYFVRLVSNGKVIGKTKIAVIK